MTIGYYICKYTSRAFLAAFSPDELSFPNLDILGSTIYSYSLANRYKFLIYLPTLSIQLRLSTLPTVGNQLPSTFTLVNPR